MNLPGSQFAELLRRSKRIAPNTGSWNDAITINTDPGVATALSMAPFQAFSSWDQPVCSPRFWQIRFHFHISPVR